MPKRSLLVLQHSEEDCGAACLASIIKHYGREVRISKIREAVGTGQQGTTLLGLKRGAEKLGFNAKMVKAPPDVFDHFVELSLPAIIHWMGKHWVILYKKKGRRYVVADPAIGIRLLSKKQLDEAWQGRAMLLLKPDPIRFYANSNTPESGVNLFFQEIVSFRGLLFEVFLCALIVGLLSLTTPVVIQFLTDEILIRQDTQLLNTISLSVASLILVSTALRYVQSNLIAQFAKRLELGLSLEFGRKILLLPLIYYETHRSGEIISRLGDIQQINQFVINTVISLPSQFFVALISLLLMMFYSPTLSFSAVVITLTMSIYTLILLPQIQKKNRELLVQDADNQGVLVETFKGALTLKSIRADSHFLEETQARFGSLAKASLSLTQIIISNNSISNLISSVGNLALLWLGSQWVISNNLSIGQLLAFKTLNDNFQVFFTTLIGFFGEMARVQTAIERVVEVIDHPSEDQQLEQKYFIEIQDNSDIVFSNISFHHPGRNNLLNDLTLTLPGGEVIAFIGPSGCGKSTLVKLLSGLYPIQSGSVRIGNYNLLDLPLDCIRKQVVLVPQEPHFWSRSIIENFFLRDNNISFEDVVNTCKLTDADFFIDKLPNRYNTVLGEFGANLSAGQRQRLAIARAIVGNPPILILDESTSNLDPISESQLVERIIAHRVGKTTIFISHRQRVIHKASWVVYLSQDHIVTQGTLQGLSVQPGEHISFLNP
jgi:ATP-binding cassette, subfamily C, bacterial